MLYAFTHIQTTLVKTCVSFIIHAYHHLLSHARCPTALGGSLKVGGRRVCAYLCKKKEIVEPEQGRLEFSPTVFSIASHKEKVLEVCHDCTFLAEAAER